jgi:hypothetical protein
LAKLPGAISSKRGHDRTFHAACLLVEGFSLSKEDALALLRDDYNPRCKPPWSEQELEHKVDDAIKKVKRPGYLLRDGTDEAAATAPQGADEGEPVHLTDIGNAKRLVRRHGRDLLHCHPWQKWLVWDGTRWATDKTAAATTRTKQTVAGLFRWATRLVDEIGRQLEEQADGDEIEGGIEGAAGAGAEGDEMGTAE